jgi:hypothetical protein
MSRRWTAKCWMGSNSGYVDIEVGASTINGAKEQLQNVYGAQQIINLREVRGNSNSSLSSPGGTMLLVGIFSAGAAFLYFTPWVLMAVYGAGATWVTQKLTGQTVEEYTNIPDEETTPEQHKKAAIVFGSALLLGMVGFVHGTMWNKDLNKEYNLNGNQSTIQQVRQK